MKAIINGKRYDTETAKLLHSWDNGYYGSDFKCCSESLYLTPRGNYFLAGEGGPMSKYARGCGDNSWCGGSGIEPISKTDALEWLENHDGDDVLDELFNGDIEDA